MNSNCWGCAFEGYSRKHERFFQLRLNNSPLNQYLILKSCGWIKHLFEFSLRDWSNLKCRGSNSNDGAANAMNLVSKHFDTVMVADLSYLVTVT